MFARNGFSLVFLLVSVGVLLVVAPVEVESADCKNSDGSAPQEGFSGFFHKVKCGLRSGAEQAADAVEDGYKYVKDKVLPTKKPEDQIDMRIDEGPREPVKLAEFQPQSR